RLTIHDSSLTSLGYLPAFALTVSFAGKTPLMHKIQQLFSNYLFKTSKILKALWLLFPSFLFLIIIWQCFWVLPQGKDILISRLEKKYVAG
ncbi:hypothetical protein, partial [Rhizobium leguminosarum]|uniref:hypothetical protein n=1 Tax=Rhizobium leguminosarum TaxID=384 RepID=UPI003F95E88D